jgi:hypothetical protein
MTTDEITQYRLRSQQIVQPESSGDSPRSPGSIVAHLGAMQAQDYPGAKWSIGLRLPGVTDTDVERAIADRTIVRTWPMRGTLHFVAAADVRWMLELLTPRVIASSTRRHQELGLDAATFARATELFASALEGGKQLTRDEMYATLEAAGISTANQRGYHILGRTAQEGLICFAAHSSKQPTFALLDEWIPNAKRLEREEALAELAKRYFIGHGPATLQDFCWWAGLTTSDARIGLEAVKADLTEATADGKTYWMRPALPPQPVYSDAGTTVHLLPGFDEYLLGYRDRSAALDPKHAPTIVPGNNGMFMSTIVVDGRVAGTWKRTANRKTVRVTAQPFEPLDERAKRGVVTAAQWYGEFLKMDVTTDL